DEISVGIASVYGWHKAWNKSGIASLLIGHRGYAGGRHRKLSAELIGSAVEFASAESLTLAQIAKKVEAIHGITLPCTIPTLGLAMKKAGFSYKRSRYSLKKKRPVSF
ncbi:MAG: hypothetical protein ACRCUZ_13590, partial [Shewanella sp.]